MTSPSSVRARDDERVGHARRGERVVAARDEPVGEPRVDPEAVVADRARLPVDERLRLRHLAAEALDDRLVAEADAERRRRRAEAEDQLDRAAGVDRPPWARRDDEAIGSELARRGDGHLVAAPDDDLGAELLEQVDEVVGERVVVVDDEDAHAFECASAGARARGSDLGVPKSQARCQTPRGDTGPALVVGLRGVSH